MDRGREKARRNTKRIEFKVIDIASVSDTYTYTFHIQHDVNKHNIDDFVTNR